MERQLFIHFIFTHQHKKNRIPCRINLMEEKSIIEMNQNNLTSNWISSETARSNAVDLGCSLSIMSYLSFAVISINTMVNLNINMVRYHFFMKIKMHYSGFLNNMIFANKFFIFILYTCYYMHDNKVLS